MSTALGLLDPQEFSTFDLASLREHSHCTLLRLQLEPEYLAFLRSLVRPLPDNGLRLAIFLILSTEPRRLGKVLEGEIRRLELPHPGCLNSFMTRLLLSGWQLTNGDRYRFWIKRDLTRVSSASVCSRLLSWLTRPLAEQAEENEIMDLRWEG